MVAMETSRAKFDGSSVQFACRQLKREPNLNSKSTVNDACMSSLLTLCFSIVPAQVHAFAIFRRAYEMYVAAKAFAVLATLKCINIVI